MYCPIVAINCLNAVFRPPDIVCRRTYILPVFLSSSFFLSFFLFFRRSISKVAERNSTKIGQMLTSSCDLKTHFQNLGYPSTNRGPQNHIFGPTLQLNGKFNGLYLQSKTRYRQSVKCFDNCKGSPTLSQNVMNFGP